VEGEGPTARLVAFVTPASAAASAEPPAALAELLPAYMIPSQLVGLERLPLTANGKVDRKALRAPARPQGPPQTLPVGELEEALEAIWRDVLAVERVGAEEDFFALGGNSLLAVQVVAEVREKLGVELGLNALFQLRTVRSLAQEVERMAAARRAAPARVLCIQPGAPARLPLFCVHPKFGGVEAYLRLAQHLGAEQPVYGIRAPELDEEVPRARTLQARAGEYLEEVRRLQPHGPYQLAGYSFGGLIAQEMARQLRGAGEEVALVGLLDSDLPRLAEEPPVGGLTGELAAAASMLDAARRAHLLGLPTDAERWAYLLRLARDGGLVHPEGGISELVRALRVARLLGEERMQHRFGAPGCPVLLLATEEQVAECGPWLGWEVLEGEAPERVVLPGSHEGMVEEPAVRQVAEVLASRLSGGRLDRLGGVG
jgi:thioesterase domain-containing protein/acyl carrier protein